MVDESKVDKPENSENKDQPQPIKIQCCPECESTRLMRDYESAEIVCMDCGFVLAAKITDSGPEWRAFDDEQRAKRSRVGAPLTYTIHDKGLSTMIDWHDRDIYGKSLSPGQKSVIYRLRKWQTRIRVSDNTERNLAITLPEIRQKQHTIGLPPQVIETASVIYRKAVKERVTRGRSSISIAAGATYLACRQCGVARTLEEIAKAFKVDKKETGRSYRLLIKELNYSVPPPVRPTQYVTKFSNQLPTQGMADEIAHKILYAAKQLKLTSGRGPTGIAAAATYIANVLVGGKKTQREIAEIAQVTEVTIRNRYKELMERLQFTLYV